jgi:hypothetical protein
LSAAPPPPRHEADRAALEGIVRHWLSFPGAADDARGIGRFWLRDAVLGPARAERALRKLSRAGLVEPRTAADGRVRWHRVAARTDAEWLHWLQRNA